MTTVAMLDAFLADVRDGKLSAVGPLADWLEEMGDGRAVLVRGLRDAYSEARRKMYATRLDVPHWETAVKMAVGDHNAAWMALQSGVLRLFPAPAVKGGPP